MSSPRSNNNNNNNNRRRRNRNSTSRSGGGTPQKSKQIDGQSRCPNEKDRMSPTTSKCIRDWGFAYYNNNSRSGSSSSDDENSSSRSRNSSESSDDARYAGAKFNSTPPASMLPSPPAHWLEEMYRATKPTDSSLDEMSSHLRQLLNVAI